MKFPSVHHLLLAGLGLAQLSTALPHKDSPRERVARGLDIPKRLQPLNRNAPLGKREVSEGVPKSAPPYDKGWRDPYDSAVDSQGKNLNPLPWRNGEGATVLGPWNPVRAQQNPDLIRPPSTDAGDVSNMHWSYVDSHVRIQPGGWTRQTTVRELGTSTQLAGVNMRLGPGVIRELHWHKEAEWAYILAGEARITALDYEGGNYIKDLEKGDLWYFPSGSPHSIQGLGENGTEFLLIFDDGNFSEDSTFLLTDWLAHTPKSVIAENFHLAPELFDTLPEKEKYIFQGQNPGPLDKARPTGEYVKKSKLEFSHKMLAQTPTQFSGGEVRIADTSNFPISERVSAAHVIIHPGALREMHWHPTADEWSFFIKGRARVTVFAAEGRARTFNYGPGDVGIVPANMGHFVENIGDEDIEMLEIFRADRFREVSLFHWLGSTPRKMVADHLFAGEPEKARKFWDEVKSAKQDDVAKFGVKVPPGHEEKEKDTYTLQDTQSPLGV